MRDIPEIGGGRAEGNGRAAGPPAARDRVQKRRPNGGPAKSRILITGGAGFLGCNIAARLAREGSDVLIFDNLSRNRVDENLDWLRTSFPERISFERGDVRDHHALREVSRRASAVIHLAAQVAVTSSLLSPIDDFDVNAGGTVVLLEALRHRAEPPPLLFASTNKVYGALLDPADVRSNGERYEPQNTTLRDSGVDERCPLDLHTPYGCSKGAADQYVLDFARVFGVPTAVFRMSCLYGPRQFGTEDQGWVAHFLIAANAGREITIYGDGRQVRDVLYVDDAVDAYLRTLHRIGAVAGSVFNLGGGPTHAISLRDLLALIRDLTGVEPKVRFDGWRTGDQRWYVSDTRKLEAATGWRARTAVRTGVRALHRWLTEARTPEPARKETEERVPAPHHGAVQ